MTVLMTPDESNFAGSVHGGTLLKLLDQVAYTCATRYAKNYAVMLSVDQVVRRTNSCYFTMVAVGPDGRPVPVPPSELRTDEDLRRHAAAGRRRDLRQEIARVTTEFKAATVP